MQNTIVINVIDSCRCELVSNVNNGANELILEIVSDLSKNPTLKIGDITVTITSSPFIYAVPSDYYIGTGNLTFNIIDDAHAGDDFTVSKIASITGNLYLKQISDFAYALSNCAVSAGAESNMIDATAPPGGLAALVGDGTTDNSPAFNALVQYVNSIGGGIIFIPNGVYLLCYRVNWRSNVSLCGESLCDVVLKPKCTSGNGFAAISWMTGDDSTTGNYSSDNPMVNCRFSNFTIDGSEQSPDSYTSWPKGINIHFLKDCVFRDLRFLNTYATGLGIDFLQNVVIDSVYCYNCGRGYVVSENEEIAGGAGIGIGTMGLANESCIIRNCITDGCGNYGIFLEGGSVFTDSPISKYEIVNNICENGRNYGIAVKGTDNVIVSNNICRNNARDGFALLPRPDRKSANLHITGNMSVKNGGCGYRFADDTNESNNIYLTHNVSSENTKDGVLVSKKVDDFSMVGNIIRKNNRGVAVADIALVNFTSYGNLLIDNETEYVFKGLPTGNNRSNQFIKMIYPYDLEWENKVYDDSGDLVDNTASKTTVNYFYCHGAAYAGFFAKEQFTDESLNRIGYVQWFDQNKNFISREGVSFNGQGYKRFVPPDGAYYVKFRLGVNTGTSGGDSVFPVTDCLVYMTDRLEVV